MGLSIGQLAHLWTTVWTMRRSDVHIGGDYLGITV